MQSPSKGRVKSISSNSPPCCSPYSTSALETPRPKGESYLLVYLTFAATHPSARFFEIPLAIVRGVVTNAWPLISFPSLS